MDFKVINKFALRRRKVDFSIGKTQDERGNEPRKSIEEHVLRIPVVQFLRKSVHLRPFRENRIANVTLGNEGRLSSSSDNVHSTWNRRSSLLRQESFTSFQNRLPFMSFDCVATASFRPSFFFPPKIFDDTRGKDVRDDNDAWLLILLANDVRIRGYIIILHCDIARARFCTGAAERQAIILSHLLIFSLRAEEEARFIFVTENKWYTIKINASFFLLISGKR